MYAFVCLSNLKRFMREFLALKRHWQQVGFLIVVNIAAFGRRQRLQSTTLNNGRQLIKHREATSCSAVLIIKLVV